MKNFKEKAKEWWGRYFIPTAISVVLSLGLAFLMKLIFNNPIVTALGGTWGDNIGFYGKILYDDIVERRKKDLKITFVGMLKVLRNAVAEFGPGEYLDTFVIRPAMMYFFPLWIGNVAVGLVIAKFAADVTFFLPVIIAYEVRKKVWKD